MSLIFCYTRLPSVVLEPGSEIYTPRLKIRIRETYYQTAMVEKPSCRDVFFVWILHVEKEVLHQFNMPIQQEISHESQIQIIHEEQ